MQYIALYALVRIAITEILSITPTESTEILLTRNFV